MPEIRANQASLVDSCMFYDNLAVYEGFGGVVLAREEGQQIAKALGSSNKNLILQNHGYDTVQLQVMANSLRILQNLNLWRHG